MILASIIVNEAFKKYGKDCVITEGTGSKHGRGSLHYVGLAKDYRINNIKAERYNIVAEIKANLNDEYDVVLEEYPDKPEWDHIHIEFQPK